MTVTIEDTGPVRVIEIEGEQRGFWRASSSTAAQRRIIAVRTLDAMLAVRAKCGFRNEIARAEAPAYIQESLCAPVRAVSADQRAACA